MKTPSNSHFWQIQRGEVEPPPIAVTLGSAVEKIDLENQTYSCRFIADERFLNPVGNVQSGILTAMLDATMGPAAGMILGDNEFAPTLDLNVSFLRPAMPGKFLCKAKIESCDKSICFASGELFDENNEIVARATSTAIVTVLKPKVT